MNELFYELFHDMPRQGPGCDEVTTAIYDQLKPMLPENHCILEVGCGTGAATLSLARHNPLACITALDNDRDALAILNRRIANAAVNGRVRTLAGSMDDMPFPDACADLIWSEGAIYIMGFQEGLAAWKRFLKPAGCMAVSEITWFTDDRPEDLQAFWNREYPQITTEDENRKRIENAGYRVLDVVRLPDTCWTDHYYVPMRDAMERLKKRHPDDPEAEQVLREAEAEIELYETYRDHFGYTFYLMQLPE